MKTVSLLSEYCAHCGHLEPVNADKFESECMRYSHSPECLCSENEQAHDMFVALANAMTHMRINDCLLTRAEESATRAMKPFADEFLSSRNSHVFAWINKDMTIK